MSYSWSLYLDLGVLKVRWYDWGFSQWNLELVKFLHFLLLPERRIGENGEYRIGIRANISN